MAALREVPANAHAHAGADGGGESPLLWGGLTMGSAAAGPENRRPEGPEAEGPAGSSGSFSFLGSNPTPHPSPEVRRSKRAPAGLVLSEREAPSASWAARGSFEAGAPVDRTPGPAGRGGPRRAAMEKQLQGVEGAVLRLYESGGDAGALDEVLYGWYEEDATFEDPLVRVRGVGEIRATFTGLHKLFWRVQVEKPIRVALWLEETEDGGGGNLLLDFRLSAQVLPLTPSLSLHVISLLGLSGDGKIATHRDSWTLESCLEALPVPGLKWAYGAARRALGFASARAFALAFALPDSSIYRSLLGREKSVGEVLLSPLGWHAAQGGG